MVRSPRGVRGLPLYTAFLGWLPTALPSAGVALDVLNVAVGEDEGVLPSRLATLSWAACVVNSHRLLVSPSNMKMKSSMVLLSLIKTIYGGKAVKCINPANQLDA